jgi:hypothetical protein
VTEQTLTAMDEICSLIERAEASRSTAGAAPAEDAPRHREHAARLFKLGAEKCRRAMKLDGLDGLDLDWFRARLSACRAGAGPAPTRPPALPARKGATSRAR